MSNYKGLEDQVREKFPTSNYESNHKTPYAKTSLPGDDGRKDCFLQSPVCLPQPYDKNGKESPVICTISELIFLQWLDSKKKRNLHGGQKCLTKQLL
jgi:hypothetical protein